MVVKSHSIAQHVADLEEVFGKLYKCDKKANVKWRMCTNYTDLKKVCLKDAYLLPSIDRLVDRVFGFQVLSFLDAYSGYNQIRMYAPDEEKTTLITEDANFCYRVMPLPKKCGHYIPEIYGPNFQVANRTKLMM